MYALHVIKYPTGRYGFVGRVPFALAYEAEGITPEEIAHAMAFTVAKAIAEKRGGYLKHKVWETKEAALAEAAAKGFAVAPGVAEV
jgi:hypothetical protein